jgi:hypothetical protein
MSQHFTGILKEPKKFDNDENTCHLEKIHVAVTHLLRIKRNCEELQDMVKNYLDLSRAEWGELEVKKSHIHYHQEVVEPCVEQTQALFDSRGVTLTVTSAAFQTISVYHHLNFEPARHSGDMSYRRSTRCRSTNRGIQAT